MPDQHEKAVYVYGVVSGREAVEIAADGIEGGGPARLVRHDGLAALVADVPPDPVPTTRHNLSAHTEVLAEAARQTTALPMRFGVVFPDERRIVDALLAPSGGELTSLLERFEGMVEATLRGYVEDEEARLREVVQQEPEIARLRDEVRAVPEDAGYYARIRLGELVASALEARRAADERRILDRLEPLAQAVERDTKLPERVVVKAAFLLERPRLQAFDREVDALARELAGQIRFSYAGPLALHSFVDVTPKDEPVPAERS
jgi:Gas vesicle synthesis protein GvpL/GvpF